MKNLAGILFGITLVLSACVKERQCECKNSNGTYIAGDTKSTRYAAKKHCESLSGGDTRCYLK